MSHPEDFKQPFPTGEENTAYAQFFTGTSYLAPLAVRDAAVVNVTFEPGCRNHWHIHHGAGQILICTAGEGWYQEAGKAASRLHRAMWWIFRPKSNIGMAPSKTSGFRTFPLPCRKKAQATSGASPSMTRNMPPLTLKLHLFDKEKA